MLQIKLINYNYIFHDAKSYCPKHYDTLIPFWNNNDVIIEIYNDIFDINILLGIIKDYVNIIGIIIRNDYNDIIYLPQNIKVIIYNKISGVLSFNKKCKLDYLKILNTNNQLLIYEIPKNIQIIIVYDITLKSSFVKLPKTVLSIIIRSLSSDKLLIFNMPINIKYCVISDNNIIIRTIKSKYELFHKLSMFDNKYIKYISMLFIKYYSSNTNIRLCIKYLNCCC